MGCKHGIRIGIGSPAPQDLQCLLCAAGCPHNSCSVCPMGHNRPGQTGCPCMSLGGWCRGQRPPCASPIRLTGGTPRAITRGHASHLQTKTTSCADGYGPLDEQVASSPCHGTPRAPGHSRQDPETGHLAAPLEAPITLWV